MASILSGYYSGDLDAACAAHAAHVRCGQTRPRAQVRRRSRPVDAGTYPFYDGDLDALLAALG